MFLFPLFPICTIFSWLVASVKWVINKHEQGPVLAVEKGDCKVITQGFQYYKH